MKSLFDAAEVHKSLCAVVQLGAVFEVRALGAQWKGNWKKSSVSGYFNNLDACLKELERLKSVEGIYITLNPVDPALLSRCCNRLDYAERDGTTSDHDIVQRRWLLLDLDPERPSRISASDSEKALARQRARAICSYLKERGWPEPLLADSGNGFHLIYPIDLPVKDDGLIKKVLVALAGRFDDPLCTIDKSVNNPSRIARLYGTLAAKGDDTPERPHRLSKLLNVPDNPQPVSQQQLEELIAESEPEPLPETVGLTSKSFRQDGKPDKSQIREMLGFIPKRPDYADWIKIVAAVGDVLPDEDAIEVLREWSPEEKPGEYEDKLRHRLENVTVGTLIYLTKQYGWKGPKNPYPWRNAEAARERQKDIAAAHDSSGSTADDETLSRLAAMPPLEYERICKAEAERLGCRASVLDSLVKAKRPSKPGNDTLQGQAVSLSNVEPWPEPVNGADVLEAVANRIGHYVVMPPGGADITALWCAHTHCYKSFMHTPRLTASSAEKQSGKTTLRDVCAEFVARPILTENTTCAVLFRLVSGQFPTLLADEYDSWIKDNEELRGLLNAGHRRGAIIHRCEGEDNEVRGFAVFAPVMLCGIGALPGTLHDRSIPVRLKRAKRGEIQARFDSRHVEVETQLCRKLARWIADHGVRIEACEPILPETMFNRVADNWRPLFAIAQIAGGDWPERCLSAYGKLTSGEFEDVETLRVALLTDVQQIFAGTWPSLDEGEEPSPIERIFSKNLCQKLADMKERPWPEVSKGKPITERWLASNLASFGIHPKNLRIDKKLAKGYEADVFKDAFERYVAAFTALPSLSKRNNVTEIHKHIDFEDVTNEGEQNQSVTKSECVMDRKADPIDVNPFDLCDLDELCYGVTDGIPLSTKKRACDENNDDSEDTEPLPF
jgi:putative DNA primase/helicase